MTTIEDILRLDMTLPEVDDKRSLRWLWEDVVQEIYDSALDTADLGRAIRNGDQLEIGRLIMRVHDKVKK